MRRSISEFLFCISVSSSLGASHNLNQSLNATLVSVFDAGVRDEMMALAQDIQAEVSAMMRTYTADRDRLKAALEPLVASSGNSICINKCIYLHIGIT